MHILIELQIERFLKTEGKFQIKIRPVTILEIRLNDVRFYIFKRYGLRK